MLGIPLEFVFFGLTLFSVALFHRAALWTALVGLVVIATFKIAVSGFSEGPGVLGLRNHMAAEWVLLSNLFLLLLGFAVLANQFERSNVPEAMPRLLPSGWRGGLALLAMAFILSIFIDNIAGAVIGGVVARHAYRDRVGIGFLAAIVTAANAGGAGSVIGDTTTTMMWIAGVSPITVAPAFIGAVAAFSFFGIAAAWQQDRLSPIVRPEGPNAPIDWYCLSTVGLMLVALIVTNVLVSGWLPYVEHVLPALGLGLWAAILITTPIRKPDWSVLGPAAKSALFLVALVGAASMMPVAFLPNPSWQTVLGLGVVAAVFDNIPLTALALKQGGYDWALLAYSVGVGGSAVWFGSSAGVAITSLFPEGRSVILWIRHGWHVPLAFVLGFFVMLMARGWNP